MSALSFVVIAPLLFYLVDGYYESNILKGVYMILGFLLTVTLVCIATKVFEWYYVCFVPVFFIVLVLLKLKKQ
jgi:hypothetical protein